MIRLFAAVFPPLEVRRDLMATYAELPAMTGLRLTRPENLHFTLAFFGEREAASLSSLSAAIARTAAAVEPFRARVGGLSGFPATDRARVLFARLVDGNSEMSTLSDRLKAELPAELRPESMDSFQPHLTLSRPRRRLARDQFEFLRRQARPWSWEFTVDVLCLVESVTAPSGARYSVRGAFTLGA